MSGTTGPVLALGAITIINQSVMHDTPFDFRVVIATGAAAVMFIPLEKAFPKAATMLAWTALAAVLLTRINGVPSPSETFVDWFEKGNK